MALLEATNLAVRYRLSARESLFAVDGVSLAIDAGEVVGLVGESGCGKSTLARALVGLVPLREGVVTFDAASVDYGNAAAVRRLRHRVQMVFQDPFSSLDPRLTIETSLAEPLASLRPDLPRSEHAALIDRWLERVGLSAAFRKRYPHELSGGQCQRVAIARALIAGPALLVCDEAVSALDVSVQAQIVELLRQLQRELQLSLLFISHHLALVSQLAQRSVVLYLGQVMESGRSTEVFGEPLHPYTRALVDAVPQADPNVERSRSRATLTGDLPSPIDRPSGCVFRTRCPLAIELCAAQRPPLERVSDSRSVACHRWRESACGIAL